MISRVFWARSRRNCSARARSASARARNASTSAASLCCHAPRSMRSASHGDGGRELSSEVRRDFPSASEVGCAYGTRGGGCRGCNGWGICGGAARPATGEAAAAAAAAATGGCDRGCTGGRCICGSPCGVVARGADPAECRRSAGVGEAAAERRSGAVEDDILEEARAGGVDQATTFAALSLTRGRVRRR